MVIAYLRITKGRQHLETQRDEIERFASDKGFTVDKWVTDVVDEIRKDRDSSLTPVASRMKKGDKIIVTDISRLGRTLSEVMGILSKLMAKGIHVYCIKDRYILDDSLDMKVVGETCFLVTEIEHHLMSIRTKEALSHKKNKGQQLGRPKGTDAKQSLLDANKEEVMNMLERGETIVTICKHFNVSRNTYYQFKRNYGI